MKDQFFSKVEVSGGSPAFWIFLLAGVFLFVFFFVRQMSYVPVDTETVKEFVVGESKGRTVSIKKYFPKPYSVNDLARGDNHDRD